jgi:hypothetical protein
MTVRTGCDDYIGVIRSQQEALSALLPRDSLPTVAFLS